VRDLEAEVDRLHAASGAGDWPVDDWVADVLVPDPR
jgi:hypothetical protein